MRLAESVKDGFFWIGPHARGAHFMNRHAGHFNSGGGTDIFRAGGFKHLGRGNAGIAHQGCFVFAVGHADAQRGNSPRIFEVGIDLAEIIEAGQ